MEKRLLLALALSFLVLLLWSKLFVPKEQFHEEKVLKKEEKKEEEKEINFLNEIIKGKEEKEILKENEFLKVLFTNKGGRIKEIKLKKYYDYDGNLLNLTQKYNPHFSPLDLNFEEEKLNEISKNELFYFEEKENELIFVLSIPDFYIKKVYKIEGCFLHFFLEYKTKENEEGFLSLGPGLRQIDPREENNKFLLPANFLYRDSIKIYRKPITKFNRKKPEFLVPVENIKYFGLEDSYFAFLIFPEKSLKEIKVYPEEKIFWKVKIKYGFKEEALNELKGKVFYDENKKEISIFGVLNEEEKEKIKKALINEKELHRVESAFKRKYSQLLIKFFPKNSYGSFKVYLGAKDYDFLKKNYPELTEILSFGLFSFIAKPLLWALKGINKFTGNYGISIIILTFFLRILLYPLNHKQIVSMKKMQKVQPKIDAIRRKYKNALRDMEERAKMNQEIMEVYKKEGINPMGGCLPLLIQIPILWAFYSLLSSAIELRNSPFIFWIKDLSSRDPYYITPILMGIAMLWQQKMTPTSGSPGQKFLINMMPVFFTFLFLNFPSGVVLYWFVNTVLQIIQTYLYRLHNKEV